jgi:hypothetical protein
MSTYSIEQLLTRWKQEDMTAEQAVGHLLQHVALLYERLRMLEKRERDKGRADSGKVEG